MQLPTLVAVKNFPISYLAMLMAPPDMFCAWPEMFLATGMLTGCPGLMLLAKMPPNFSIPPAKYSAPLAIPTPRVEAPQFTIEPNEPTSWQNLFELVALQLGCLKQTFLSLSSHPVDFTASWTSNVLRLILIMQSSVCVFLKQQVRHCCSSSKGLSNQMTVSGVRVCETVPILRIAVPFSAFWIVRSFISRKVMELFWILKSLASLT